MICINFSGILHCMRWYATGWRCDVPIVYSWRTVKVMYTVWGIYHANYDIFHAIKVANEVCMGWTIGGGAHCCSVLFKSVTFKLNLKSLRLYGTMQLQLQQRWHCGLEVKGQWRWTHGTVQVVFTTGTWSSVLIAARIQDKFTSACVALAIIQVRNQRIKSQTTDWLPLITIFPKIGSAGTAWPSGRFFFQRLDSWWFEV